MHGGPNNSGIVSLSTGPLARPFSCLLAPLTRLFVPDCSLRLRPPLRSLVRSLAHSLVRGKVNYQMVILSVFFFIFDHSAPMVSLDSCLAGLRPPSQFSSWTFGRYPSTFFSPGIFSWWGIIFGYCMVEWTNLPSSILFSIGFYRSMDFTQIFLFFLFLFGSQGSRESPVG